jgi:hypothetical protein
MGLLVIVPQAFRSVHIRVAASPLPPVSQGVHVHASIHEPEPVELEFTDPPLPLPLLDSPPVPPVPHNPFGHGPDVVVFSPSELQLVKSNALSNVPASKSVSNRFRRIITSIHGTSVIAATGHSRGTVRTCVGSSIPPIPSADSIYWDDVKGLARRDLATAFARANLIPDVAGTQLSQRHRIRLVEKELRIDQL